MGTDTARQPYQKMFESAPWACLMTDAEGVVEKANQAAATLFQVEQDFLIGRPVGSFLAQGEHDGLRARLASFLDVQPGVSCEWDVHIALDGRRPFPATVTLCSVVSPDGKVTGFCWYLQDTRTSKRTERLLQAAHHLVQIANRHTNLHPLLQEFVSEVR
jgi:PAS domain S-box-containing protein